MTLAALTPKRSARWWVEAGNGSKHANTLID
jgi:hypothetical protein